MRRIRSVSTAAADANLSFWHSATFNNDGKKILFSDEWGGGGQPRCRATDKMEWGADALFTIENNKMTFQSYYKMPAAQTSFENCVAHNGSLIPIPGRDVMVQSWYQGGVSVFDWTDVAHPKEIAFFDRGPIDAHRMVERRLVVGLLVQRRHRQLGDRARARHLRALCRAALITQNEIDAAKTVQLRLSERSGPAEVRVAAELRARARVRRPAPSARRGCPAARITAVRVGARQRRRSSPAARVAPRSTARIVDQRRTVQRAARTRSKVKLLAEGGQRPREVALSLMTRAAGVARTPAAFLCRSISCIYRIIVSIWARGPSR